MGLDIAENSIEIANPLIGTFIPDDQKRKKWLPVPVDFDRHIYSTAGLRIPIHTNHP